MKRWHKTTLVVLGAVVLSTVAIQASDLLRGIEGNLAGSAIDGQSVCGKGAVEMMLGSGTLCVDIFEASANKSCPQAGPSDSSHTQDNLNNFDCTAKF